MVFKKGYTPWNKNRITVPRKFKHCLFCDKKFKIIITSNRKFCSESCANKFRIGKKLSKRHRNKISKTLEGHKQSKKTIEKISKSLSCENHPNWKGGISFLPYCKKFNDILKKFIRKRDNYTCQRCGKRQKKHGRKLSVHHIHFDKENCYPDLIALCLRCNIIVNGQRKNSEKYFMKNLKKRGLLNWKPL